MDTNGTSWLAWPDQIVDVMCKLVLCVTSAAMFAILLANVFLRYLFGTSLEWAAELPELLFPWFVMSGVVLATSHNAHIYIGFVTDRTYGAMRVCLALLRSALIVSTYAVLAWVTLDLLPIVADERTPILGVPGSLTYFCLLLGFALIGLKEITLLVRALHGVPTPHEKVAYE
ncbi:TRAP transporter small permease [Arenibaculum pallidiluteum]|uniref:TRAP transporter small permease n=1 Tax=Arenibaculum pallidiluteum TaxID=2812559 RepID=UPI001A970E81|nr:TRAP transporter small permease [Arenibaculum pallidiluteum]